MSFYNHRTSISNTTNSISPFYFDKIYTSRKQMDDNCANDGVYLGRFVLVKYGEDDGVGGHQITLNNNNFSETLGVTWTNNFWDDAIKYWDIQRQGGNLNINVLGYDNTVWQKNLVDGKMKYIMVSSLYSPEIDMTANLLNGELIGGNGIIVNQSPLPGSTEDMGYNYTYTFKVKLSDLSLAFGNSGGLKVNRASNSGLRVDGNGLSVSAGDGIKIDSNDVAVNLDRRGGLECAGSQHTLQVKTGDGLTFQNGEPTDANYGALKVKLPSESSNGPGLNFSSNGGLQVSLADESGLAFNSSGKLMVNPGTGLVIDDLDGTLNSNLEAGDGIVLSQSGNKIIIINSAPNADLAADSINLVGGTDYDIFYFNNVFLTDDYNDAKRWNKWYSANQHYIYVADGASPQSATQQNIETYHITTFSRNALKYPKFTVNLVKDSNNNIISGYFKIESFHFSQVGPIVTFDGGTGTTSDPYRFTNTLEFNHTRIWNTPENKKTWLFAIRFKGNYSSLKSKTFIQNTSGLNGIWNIGRRVIADSQTGAKGNTLTPVGASWNSTCRMTKVTSTNTTDTDIINSFDLHYTPQAGDLIFYAAAYGDGFNKHLDHWAETITVADKNLYASNLNFVVEGNLK